MTAASYRQAAVGHLRARPSLVALCLGLLALLALARRPVGTGSEGHGLARALAIDGLTLQPGGVVWLAPDPGPFRRRPAVLRAHEGGGLADLYYAEVRATQNGRVLDVSWLSNLTRTSAADETLPVRVGWYLAYSARVAGHHTAVSVLDLRGQPRDATAHWPAVAKWQQRISNLEQVGRSAGLGRVRYELDPPAERLSIRADGGELRVIADADEFRIDPAHPVAFAVTGRLRAEPEELAQPGRLTWVVDTVRGLSFVGPEPIAWLEHRVYGLKDRFDRIWYSAVGTDTEADVSEDLGTTVEERRRRIAMNPPEPELGLPPASLEPLVERPADGEGEWVPVVDDPFVRSTPHAPPAFYQTFLQVDLDRPFTRVYIVLWDARQVQLRVMTGTREPENDTGGTGPGQVPRDDFTLRHMVAGFNGAFQSIHGEFGMKSEGRVYLPPKPWAATVAVYQDGTVAMGSWRGPPDGETEYREDWATAQIPESMVELRQNLTSVVEGDRYNPWRRWWWGAAPRDADDQVFMDRSGLCLTREGFLAYFWGKSMGADELGAAMLKARCVRGIHLDMNQRHTAFEFYDVHGPDEPPPSLGRRLTSMEFSQPVQGVEGYVMRGRKAVRSMTPMRFPRYMRRDQRDFFYLTLKPVLPGPDLRPETHEGEGLPFSTDGLPQRQWPPPFARLTAGGTGAQTFLIRIDPRRGRPGPIAGETHGDALGYVTAPTASGGRFGLYAEPRTVGYAYGVGEAGPDARLLVSGHPVDADTMAAIGVTPDGFWVYGERESADAPALTQLLARASVVGHIVALDSGTRLAFAANAETYVGPDGYERAVVPADALLLADPGRAPTEVLFPDVQPRPYMYWYRMQDTRVRYFRDSDEPPRFRAPDAGP